MTLTVFQVDAFTDRMFGGNPAAVCLLPAWPADDWMQALAGEMNLSDTAFGVRRDDQDVDLRWFTPRTEVTLRGHATLATAHVLWQERVIHEPASLGTPAGHATPRTCYRRSASSIRSRSAGAVPISWSSCPPNPTFVGSSPTGRDSRESRRGGWRSRRRATWRVWTSSRV